MLSMWNCWNCSFFSEFDKLRCFSMCKICNQNLHLSCLILDDHFENSFYFSVRRTIFAMKFKYWIELFSKILSIIKKTRNSFVHDELFEYKSFCFFNNFRITVTSLTKHKTHIFSKFSDVLIINLIIYVHCLKVVLILNCL